MATRRRLRGGGSALVALCVVAGVLTACSSADSTPELTGVRVVTAPSTVSWSGAPILGMRVRYFRNGVVVGPHYTLGVSWVATGPELAGRDASGLSVQPVRAPGGDELLIAAVAPDATRAAFTPATPPTVVASIDGRDVPLSGLPLADAHSPMAPATKLIMLSVPPPASVALRVTDDGQSQTVDLRAGTTSGHGYSQRQDSGAVWRGQSTVTFPNPPGVPGVDTGTITLDSPTSTTQPTDYGYVFLTNYQGRWAPRGREFLIVPVPDVACDDPLLQCQSYSAESDDSALFSFESSNGEHIAARPAPRAFRLFPQIISDSPISTVVFDVPDDTVNGTVTLDLAKARWVDNQGGSHPVTPPQPFTLNVTFFS